jgi:hypothetical protein
VNGRPRQDATDHAARAAGAGLVAALVAVAVVGGGAADGLGAGAVSGGADALPGDLASDVVDSLPGRNPATRRTGPALSTPRPAERGLEQARAQEHQLDCVTAATGEVRTFLVRTPCTSLDRVILTGRIDGARLDAVADVAIYLPVR